MKKRLAGPILIVLVALIVWAIRAGVVFAQSPPKNSGGESGQILQEMSHSPTPISRANYTLQNADVPPDLDYRCEAPSFTEFTDAIPVTANTKYTVAIPEGVIACAAEFYQGDTLVTYHGGLDLIECAGGYCTEGLGMWKRHVNDTTSFWWVNIRPTKVRIYFRKHLPGEPVPSLTPAPDPEPQLTATPTDVVGPAPHPRPYRAYLPMLLRSFVNYLLGR